jgi:hypothetical protein
VDTQQISDDVDAMVGAVALGKVQQVGAGELGAGGKEPVLVILDYLAGPDRAMRGGIRPMGCDRAATATWITGPGKCSTHATVQATWGDQMILKLDV